MPGSDGKAERVLVTGAEGCIGSWAVRRLLAADVPVVACDLAPAPQRISRSSLRISWSSSFTCAPTSPSRR